MADGRRKQHERTVAAWDVAQILSEAKDVAIRLPDRITDDDVSESHINRTITRLQTHLNDASERLDDARTETEGDDG